ncbi:MmcQ/YjbR family DNA-binding protein [Brevundimonas lenta]|uniref:Putative DNA-binding protein (MmcQ/YjbR family) n=1 Tax=Brevundimonas lenta TaxID=424796 RepID=A0A7W6NNL9_9CAUL|nr:MmcQ/YjbR family DNA-binding protein [Brevundimonas lenta]MBB4081287.1 putative DNA-binding protein (MmcQ/YjbR family) [Brevundimonas lenta]
MSAPADAADALRAFGLTYPEAHLKSPWPGHADLAVKDKTFAYLSVSGDPFSLSCKLPFTAAEALEMPFVQPTGYGLGKSGWVTASWPEDIADPLPMFRAWIDESYRAQASKKLIALAPAFAG